MTARLLKRLALALPFALLVLWLGGVLDEIEWHDDFLTGVVVSVLSVAHIAAGYAFPRARTYVIVTALWFIPTAGVDLTWSVTGWDPWNTPREDPDCDPCVAPSFGFFFIVLALPLVALGHGLRRLDHWHATRL